MSKVLLWIFFLPIMIAVTCIKELHEYVQDGTYAFLEFVIIGFGFVFQIIYATVAIGAML